MPPLGEIENFELPKKVLKPPLDVTKLSPAVSELLSKHVKVLLSKFKAAVTKALDGLDMDALAASAAKMLFEQVHKALQQRAQAYIKEVAQDLALEIQYADVVSPVGNGEKLSPAEMIHAKLKPLMEGLRKELERKLDTATTQSLLHVGSTLVNQVRGGVETLTELKESASAFEEQLQIKLMADAAANTAKMDPESAEWQAALDALAEKDKDVKAYKDGYKREFRGDPERFVAELTKHGIVLEGATKHLPQGKLSNLVAIHRVRETLERPTEYSRTSGGCCSNMCSMAGGTLSRSRSVLTQHEDELGARALFAAAIAIRLS
jgi:hypothetical protein